MREITLKQPPFKIVLFLLSVQLLVFYGHWLLYATIIFTFMPGPEAVVWLRAILFGLSFYFVIMQILNQWNSRVLDILYTISAVWIGTIQLLFMACAVFWILAEVIVPFGVLPPWTALGTTIFTLTLLISAYGVVRSFRPRYKRYYVNIPNLPPEWRGRKAVMVSDVHLGNVRGNGSIRKMVRMVNAEKPDIVFIPGDLFDGSPVKYEWMVAPLSGIVAPHGAYFIEGNHEEFRDPAPYLAAIRAAGVKILDKEMVVIDGMQILGIPYRDSNEPEEVRDSLAAIPFDAAKPSILLKHAPSSPRAAAVAGISLMLCGHTHNGQVWPYNLLVRRLFGQAGYGYSQTNNMQIITTSGYGTWGPPQRLGTKAEVVVIKFS